MSRFTLVCVVAAASLGLMACSEKPQTAVIKKADTEPWVSSSSGFVAPGWKEGDRGSWEEQLRSRAQGQNEYAKAK